MLLTGNLNNAAGSAATVPSFSTEHEVHIVLVGGDAGDYLVHHLSTPGISGRGHPLSLPWFILLSLLQSAWVAHPLWCIS